MRVRSLMVAASLTLLASVAAACGGGGEEDLPACPDGGTDLTYDTFGKAFMDNYCTSCHTAGSGVSGADSLPLDSLSAVQAEIEEVYEKAGGTNTSMPPGGNAAPSASEREQLAEWLSCGAK
ncbi:MAG: c-type cytochrome [Polyangiaceae bacterium]|nr:c-type cytochrome [Polyangiaceae bacterium]